MSHEDNHDDLLGGWGDDTVNDVFSGDTDMFGLPEEDTAPEPKSDSAAGFSDNGNNSEPESFQSDLGEKAKKQTEGYVVLARKYRPQTFGQLVGQESVQGALSGAISSGQISHAYLFSGPRGTGKTSTARILAKSVNCQTNGPRPDPCGQCASCKAITAGSSLDVIEIDAASNTGVDNIRELRSGVALAPFSRFKVYIVDEVHMLSNQAFNALLKTLEEPPPQVIFVLATTELHKVPETIISRCQSFSFKRFSLSELKSQLGKILDIETQQRGISVDPGEREKILDLIAKSADGGMRDAQVTLDQALVLSQDKLNFETVRRFLGMIDSERMDVFLNFIAEKNTEGLLNTIDELVSDGQDLELFIKCVCEHVRDLLIIKATKSRSSLVSMSDDRYNTLKQNFAGFSFPFLHTTANVLLRLSEEMKLSNQPRFVLELAVLKLTLIDAYNESESLAKRVQLIEQQINSGSFSTSTPSSQGALSQEKKKPELDEKVDSSKSALETNAKKDFQEDKDSDSLPKQITNLSADHLLNRLRTKTDETNHILHVTLVDFTSAVSYDGKVLSLEIDETDKFGVAQFNRPGSFDSLKKLAAEIVGFEIQISWKAVSKTGRAEPQDSEKLTISRAEVAPALQPIPTSKPKSVFQNEPAFLESSDGEIVEEFEENEYNPTFYYNDDARQKMMQTVPEESFQKILNSRADLMQIVENAKKVFKLDDKSFRFKICNI